MDEMSATIDHLKPVSKGGHSSPENIVICCKTCNSSKRDKTLEEFRLRYAANASNLPVNFTLPQLQFLDSIGVLREVGVKDGVKFFIETIEEDPFGVTNGA